MKVSHLLTETGGGGAEHVDSLVRGVEGRGIRASTYLWQPRFVRVSSGHPCGNAEILHSHGIRAAMAAPKRHGAIHVVTLHGLHAFYREKGLRRVLVKAGIRRALRNADAVVCVAEHERQVLSSLGVSAEKAVLIENGVPPRPLTTSDERSRWRKDFGIPSGAKVVAFVGGLRFQKDPIATVAAVQAARRRVPDLWLLIAGNGPLMAEVQGVAAAQDVILGSVESSYGPFAAADVVINTSRWEGLSLALLEAMWQGVPTVGYDGPGNREAVGEAGVLVAAGELELLASELAALLLDDGRLAHLRSTARRRAEERFGADRMVEETLSLYARLLGPSIGARAGREGVAGGYTQ